MSGTGHAPVRNFTRRSLEFRREELALFIQLPPGARSDQSQSRTLLASLGDVLSSLGVGQVHFWLKPRSLGGDLNKGHLHAPKSLAHAEREPRERSISEGPRRDLRIRKGELYKTLQTSQCLRVRIWLLSR